MSPPRGGLPFAFALGEQTPERKHLCSVPLIPTEKALLSLPLAPGRHPRIPESQKSSRGQPQRGKSGPFLEERGPEGSAESGRKYGAGAQHGGHGRDLSQASERLSVGAVQESRSQAWRVERARVGLLA